MAELRAGHVGAVLLAGGMGTRLGSDAPKGAFNIGIKRELYIFECLINNLLNVTERVGSFVHLFIMTSDKTTQQRVRSLQNIIISAMRRNSCIFHSGDGTRGGLRRQGLSRRKIPSCNFTERQRRLVFLNGKARNA